MIYNGRAVDDIRAVGVMICNLRLMIYNGVAVDFFGRGKIKKPLPTYGNGKIYHPFTYLPICA